MLIDSEERHQATSPYHSYIVEAPAGSGKTELLTQRFLRLLSGVEAPEQIVALTFTRKAANEMRERIVVALQKAANQTDTTSPHEEQTRGYAMAALKKDAALNWNILAQPNRLRIITIDALCQMISHAIPLQDRQIAYADICDKPDRHYLAAAQSCLAYLLEEQTYQDSIKTLLEHVDNRQDLLLSLLSDLLGHRHQWLRMLYQAKNQDKATYEAALSFMLQHELGRFQQSIPHAMASELIDLVQGLVSIDKRPNAPFASLLNWQEFNQLSGPLARDLAALLLTSQNKLRKAFDHHIGLKRDTCSKEIYDDLKSRSASLLGQLELLPDFLDALLRIKDLPDPHYSLSQWKVLQALFTILPLLVAHLSLIFTKHNEVDFTAISEEALQALGDEDYPTDLALYFDNQIQHLLVDEFQDTSIQQYQLLTKLVEGWQHDDGKTLFLVGDPMQSIYRFRQAEVGLFLRAKDAGIGPVQLISLALKVNFRSNPTLVHWVNQQFKSIFPKKNDIESGAISFHASVAIKPEEKGHGVAAFQYQNRQAEATALVEQIAVELASYPNDHIAILVRSRHQLTAIVQQLREKNIPFQGIDIDPLAKLSHLQDVWSLTEALLMPANRLAWLAFLRSSFCGLSLEDLFYIANHDKNKSIYETLMQVDQIRSLSADGLSRARYVYHVLDDALTNRHQQPLIPWLLKTLKALHMDAVLDEQGQQDLEQFWILLKRFDRNGYISDMAECRREFKKLYSQQVTPSRLQIMTIHKSKGLEFDSVFLPGLSTKSNQKEAPFIRFLQLPSQEDENLLLVSPLKAAEQKYCLLYDYLGLLDNQKSHYELQRLLYVAVTRAKKRLYLYDNHDKINQGTFKQLLKKQVFTSIVQDESEPEVSCPLPTTPILPSSFYANDYLQKPTPMNDDLKLLLMDQSSRFVGIVTHELLQWICDNHPTSVDEVPWTLAHHQLKALGFNNDQLSKTLATIKNQITPLFQQPIGQWIIKAQVAEQNEYEILVEQKSDHATKIIDRTFFENGERWIIDFKTGHDDDLSMQHHQNQVDRYAQYFIKKGEKTIHCGLYYLANHHWVTWEHNNK